MNAFNVWPRTRTGDLVCVYSGDVLTRLPFFSKQLKSCPFSLSVNSLLGSRHPLKVARSPQLTEGVTPVLPGVLFDHDLEGILLKFSSWGGGGRIRGKPPQ